ncbi:DUF4355 domain-containing protein [uncultured Merdimonas sp.]|uniref:DUF4355 domain-containing protein n=1 Tax=uncultured Merdimonas sp. TaxID=2023269 RepID=UPI003208FB58
MKLKDLLKLQLFADDSGSGDGGSSESGGNPGGGSDPDGDDPNDGGDDDDDPDPEKKYTVEEVNNLIKRKKAEWEKQRKKDDDEAKKFAKMNAQEKAEYKQQQLEKRIQELEDEKTLSGMRDEARKQLSEKGINISDNLLEFMVSKDAEKTKKAVDSFAELFNAAVNEAVKGKARQTTPKEGGGFVGGKEKLNIKEMAKEARIIK